jgi:hypothetical protein
MSSDWIFVDALFLYYGIYCVIFTCSSVEW